MTFTAQELNHRIAFEASQEVQDPDTGALSVSWVQVAVAFAKVEPLVGREYFAAQAVQAEGSVKFTIRHRADVLPNMRLIHLGEPWNITSVINIKGGNRETLIYAKRLE